MPPFSRVLKSIVPRPCYGRPFICDGRPEQCTVVVIGENPATELGTDWWMHWDDTEGFMLAEWTAAYQASRVRRGKKPVSPTRLRLDRLRCHGVRCLETNVFFNAQLGGPGHGRSNTDLLELALSTLPQIQFMIAHGRTAHNYLQSQMLPKKIRKVYQTRHFRTESYDTIDFIAVEILATQKEE